MVFSGRITYTTSDYPDNPVNGDTWYPSDLDTIFVYSDKIPTYKWVVYDRKYFDPFGVGYVYDTTTSLEKLSFSSETMSSTSNILPSGYDTWVGVSSSSAGYSMRGAVSGTNVSSIYKLHFNDDSQTMATISAVTSSAGRNGAGFVSSTKGYAVTNYDGTNNHSTIDKLVFAEETGTTSSTTISDPKLIQAGFSSSLMGYTVGGSDYHDNASYAKYTTVERLTFANDDSTSTVFVHSYPLETYGSIGINSSLNAYVAGGDPQSGSFYSSIYKFSFSNTSAGFVLDGTLSAGRRSVGAVNSTLSAYFIGGQESSSVSTIEKVTFSSSGSSVLSVYLTTAASPGVKSFNTTKNMYDWFIYTVLAY